MESRGSFGLSILIILFKPFSVTFFIPTLFIGHTLRIVKKWPKYRNTFPWMEEWLLTGWAEKAGVWNGSPLLEAEGGKNITYFLNMF